jgi:hypothetical protein
MRIKCSTRIGATINEFMHPLYPALFRIKNTAPLICLSGWLDPFVGMQFSFFQLDRRPNWSARWVTHADGWGKGDWAIATGRNRCVARRLTQSANKPLTPLEASSFLLACRSSVSSRAKRDAVWPSHRTPCQNPLPSRHMILNFEIEPWCQYLIFRKTASISSITGS